ncbi:2-oxo-hepta-3-ene-1,7-dioic acid hydratase [Nocardioides sp. zg-578]|uniref:2-oxo-hepta-3-ene-1,7-dioic acid hydratase n=1 Tax=Nocardioides marmotae TaxID=2663857 RepID=A0A6I3J0X6_9ACTN|nr:2-oxo-hepta-3-ene-1,7-dioic acid hydratase [Nocardioides marmotae]MCR6030264.1 2-oxo-hepta-3-ene-1,7-dioic acid hydratase [Gordonia jinghuaiqii]MTB85545.1 2-oxo-hepta-3-ene-1,7-dioic acid hydratase [Nocardioides marmotae]MTB93896.1 2-oxo-hepta-3-ene-1,7-dioic acid hydratase [Nocardioides marmotae]QKE03323.1 2-oxo-hepta-3-ene-1,7-dioic acid hydratase [Nocardioides marmotae]
MIDDAAARQLAHELQQAEQDRTQIEQISRRFPDMTIPDAYRVQRAWVDLQIAEGARQVGRKIGLTSRAMQRSSKIDEPDYGVLLDHMVYADGSLVPPGRFIVPRVEVELAFILGRDLSGPGCTIFDVLAATEYVVPAIEIIDARIERIDAATGATRKVFDTISDNAANAGIVLGGTPVRVDAVDLRWVSALVYQNGVVEDSGVAGAVLGHPAHGPAWLANKIAPYGEKLAAGEIVLGGSFIAPLEVEPGDHFHAEYGPLGSVGVRFA